MHNFTVLIVHHQKVCAIKVDIFLFLEVAIMIKGVEVVEDL